MRIAILLCLFLTSPALAQSSNMAVTFLTKEEVQHLIQTAPQEDAARPGLYSLNLSSSSPYPVLGIRRTAPGQAEVHAGFADVWYVVDGAGTLVTGGVTVNGRATGPGEVRGEGIKAGQSRRVRPGDMVVIPAGTPHWISAIDGDDLLYLVVKLPVRQ